MDLSKPEKKRLFLAIDLPGEIKTSIRGAVQELEGIGARVVWTRLENLHLTLKFLGNTSVEQLDKVKSLLDDVAEQSPSFKVTLKGLGGFPNEKKPRIVWMGVDQGENELKRLFYLMEQAVVPIGFKEEKNEFLPHLTLGRIKLPKTNKELEQKIVQERERSFGEWQVNSFKLFESLLTREGPVYQVLDEFKL